MYDTEMLDRVQQERAQRVVELASQAFGVSVTSILSESRKANAASARFAIAWVLRQQGWSLSEIGAALQRDHSTVTNAINQAGRRMRVDRDYRLLTLPLLETVRSENPILQAAELDERMLLSVIRIADDLVRLASDVGEMASKLASAARVSLEASSGEAA